MRVERVVAGLVVAVLGGCVPKPPAAPLAPDDIAWVKHISPDGVAAFDYPAGFAPKPIRTVRPPRPSVHAVLFASPDAAVEVGIMYCAEPPPTGIVQALATAAGKYDIPITEAKRVAVNGAPGHRQEFRGNDGGPPTEAIVVAVGTPEAFALVVAAYATARRAELRPVCERVVGSVTLKRPATAD